MWIGREKNNCRDHCYPRLGQHPKQKSRGCEKPQYPASRIGRTQPSDWRNRQRAKVPVGDQHQCSKCTLCPLCKLPRNIGNRPKHCDVSWNPRLVKKGGSKRRTTGKERTSFGCTFWQRNDRPITAIGDSICPSQNYFRASTAFVGAKNWFWNAVPASRNPIQKFGKKHCTNARSSGKDTNHRSFRRDSRPHHGRWR